MTTPAAARAATTGPQQRLLRRPGRGPARRRTWAVVLAAGVVVTTLLAIEISRDVAQRAGVQTQWPTLVLAILLTCWAPTAFGVGWGTTGRHLRAVLVTLTGVAAAVGVFRLAGGTVPWSGWEVWVAVPLAEELLFRGFCLTGLLWAFGRGFSETVAVRGAILLSATVFALEHLGNAAIGMPLLAIQVGSALAFGLAAGWLRVITRSLVGPVLAHATLNVIAVA